MLIRVVSKNYGVQEIDLETFNPARCKGSTIYQVVQHIFQSWYDYMTEPGAPGEYQAKYCGDIDQPAIYDVHGAIVQGVETFIEIAQETGIRVWNTRQISALDIEAAFE